MTPSMRRRQELTTDSGMPIISCAIDDVAMAALRTPAEQEFACSLCDAPIEGQPVASGLMLWWRGDEVRVDEPPLCRACAATIGVTAIVTRLARKTLAENTPGNDDTKPTPDD